MNFDKIRLIPIPISGVILSLMGLALFFKDYSMLNTEIFTLFGVALIILLLLKLIFYSDESKKDLKSPIILGTFATFPMALMILSNLIVDLNYYVALGLWFVAFFIHVILIIFFFQKHIIEFELDLLFTNYFVVFIGFGMACITGTAFKLQTIIDLVFIFSVLSMIVLLFFVTYRYIRMPIFEKPFKPLVCIYAAPFSLILCAFIQTSFTKPVEIIIALYILSLVFFVYGAIKVVQYIRLPFFPTFTAFTFPFVISAIATKQIMNYLNIHLGIILQIQILISIIFVACVLAQYISFIITAPDE